MRFRSLVPVGLLGQFVLTAVGCAGSSPSQPPADLPAAAGPQNAVSARQPAAASSRGAHQSGGVRRATAGCTMPGSGSFVGGGSGNVAGGPDSGVLSGVSNDACDDYSAVVAGLSNTVSSGSLSGAENSMIGAGYNNAISGSLSQDSFIGAGDHNALAAVYAVIGGGQNNTINSGPDWSLIGGGSRNTIGTGASYGVLAGGDTNSLTAYVGTLAGGRGNAASGSFGALAGGLSNTVSAEYGAVGGGSSNTASGTEATVPGGGANVASGYASFAAGYHADANQAGSFVWSDNSSGSATKPTVADQFVARASGGVEFFSNSAMTTGVKLAAGGGSWASLSDRAVKTGVEPINDRVILDKVASMPISEWSYISERGVRHVGPMAQDFYAAFGVGEDNKHITSIDEDGVALAAIKALHEQVTSLRAQLAHKNDTEGAMRRQLSAMQRQVQRVTAMVEALQAR